MFSKAIIVASLLAIAFGCESPVVESSSYTSKEDISSSRTLFVSKFTVKCKDGSLPSNLFAEVGDKPLAVGKSPNDASFQVSWSAEHRSAGSGTYTVNLYDDAGYSNLKKAQRAGESVDSIKPLATLDIVHQGVWKGAWISSETVACIASLALLWFAYSKKNDMLA